MPRSLSNAFSDVLTGLVVLMAVAILLAIGSAADVLPAEISDLVQRAIQVG